MKIVHIIVGLETGGAENMLRRLVETMATHEHVVVSLTSMGKVGMALQGQGIQVLALNTKGPMYLLSAFLRLRLILIQHKPAAVQTWMYHADFLGGLAAKFAGCDNVIWNIRNTEIPQSGFSLTGLIIRACALLSYVIPRKIVCCAEAAKQAHLLLGYSAKKMLVIPNGYDMKSFLPVTQAREDILQELCVPSDSLVIGVVGRFDPLKGHDVFLRAAAIIANRFHNVFFVLIGRHIDEGNDELMAWVRATGHSARFRLMGERCDIPRIMSVMDLYCLASRAEGFPNVVAEAMAMKVPCVVTDVGDAALIVGPTGLVVPPRQPETLASALEQMLRLEDSNRKKLGALARSRIEEHYSIELIGKKYESIYFPEQP